MVLRPNGMETEKYLLPISLLPFFSVSCQDCEKLNEETVKMNRFFCV